MTTKAYHHTLAEVVHSAAYVAGRRAGMASLSPGTCPYTDGSAEAVEWQRGLQSALDQINAYANSPRIPAWTNDPEYDRYQIAARGRV